MKTWSHWNLDQKKVWYSIWL